MNTRIKTGPMQPLPTTRFRPLASLRVRLAAGFLLWVMAMGCAIGTSAALSGCAGVSQAVQAYGTVAVTGAHAAADTLVQAQKVTICDLPYSAVQRDAQMVAIVPILCGPLK